jgi:hypothetical protein
MQCEHCGFTSPFVTKHCGGCGKALSQLRRCSCGFRNPSGFSFCGDCGKRLKQAPRPKIGTTVTSDTKHALWCLRCAGASSIRTDVISRTELAPGATYSGTTSPQRMTPLGRGSRDQSCVSATPLPLRMSRRWAVRPCRWCLPRSRSRYYRAQESVPCSMPKSEL